MKIGKSVSRGLNRSNQGGQALLVVLLILSVILTVVLSSVSRTVTDISISTIQEDSSRAFNAAEAGIEEALLRLPIDIGSSVNITDTLDDDSSYDVVIQTPNYSDGFVYPTRLVSGEVATFWFVEATEDGAIKCAGSCMTRTAIANLCWGTKESTNYDLSDGNETNQTPAIELSVYYDWDPVISGPRWVTTNDFSNVRVIKAAYDPVSGRRTVNNFESTDPGSCIINGIPFEFRKGNVMFNGDLGMGVPIDCFTSEGCIIMAKVRMFYNNDSQNADEVAVGIPASELPTQGYLVSSTGAAGDSVRKLDVFQTFPEPPIVFENVLNVRGGIVK